MPSYTFHSDDPDAFSLAYDPARPGQTPEVALALGERAERAMSDPAYFDPCHPRHAKVVSDATSAIAAIVGTRPIDGGQPFAVQTLNSADGSVVDRSQWQPATVFDPSAPSPDEHRYSDGSFGIQTFRTGP